MRVVNSVLYPAGNVKIPHGAMVGLQALPGCVCRKSYVNAAEGSVDFWEPEGWNCNADGCGDFGVERGKMAVQGMASRKMAWAIEPTWC